MAIHLWQRVGSWATVPGHFDRIGLPPRLESAHVGWIAFQLRNEGVDHDVSAELAPGTAWRADVERGGRIALVGWSVLGTDPLADAEADAQAVERYRLAGWIADVEQHHHRGWGGDPGRSTVYAGRMRELVGPEFPLGFSTFGCAAGANLLFHVNSFGGDPPAPPMNGKAFFDKRFWLMPQAYPNQFGQTAESYTPENCVAHAARAGWPLDRAALTLGIYDAPSPPGYGRLSLEWYRERMLGKGTIGFNVYFGDNMRQTPADFDTCRDMVSVQKLAYKEGVSEPAPVPPVLPIPTPAEPPEPREQVLGADWLERRDALRRILDMTPEDWAARKDAILEAVGGEILT